MARRRKKKGASTSEQAPATTDALAQVIEIETSAAALAPRLEGVMRDRSRWLQRRSMLALKTMGQCVAGMIGAVLVAYFLWRFGNSLDGDWDELFGFAAFFVLLCSLVPTIIFLVEIPALIGRDPYAGYLRAVIDMLRKLQPDLHPESRVRLELDLRELKDTTPYQTGTSPYSGSTKKWFRLVRLRLVLALADGTVMALRATEKAKTKAGSNVWTEGQLVGRIEGQGNSQLRPSGDVPELSGWMSGWKTATTGRALLFWQKSGRFQHGVPDLAAIYAALRPAAGAPVREAS